MSAPIFHDRFSVRAIQDLYQTAIAKVLFPQHFQIAFLLGVENTLIVGIMQRGKAMRQPGNGVALAAAGRMLDQIVVAGTFRSRSSHQLPNGLKLMIAREDHCFLFYPLTIFGDLFINLEMQKTGKQIKQTVPLEHLLPKIGRAVGSTFWVRRISGAVVISSIKRLINSIYY